MTTRTRPFSGFEWLVAGRYLRAKRAESFISVISGFSLVGIALGVATLIIVMSVMNGFRAQLLGRILGLNGHAVVQMFGGVSDYDAITERLRTVQGVTAAFPIVEGQVLVNTEGTSRGALVRGMKSDDLRGLTEVATTLSPNALDGFDDGESVILGARLAQQLGLVPGMTVTLIAPKGEVTPFGSTPRIKTYRLAGTFNVGMSEYDQTFIFMPLMEAQLFFGQEGTVCGILVMVNAARSDRRMASTVAGSRGQSRRRRLAADEFEPVRRAPGRAQRDVPDPDAHHPRCRAQHHLRPHHAGEGQGRRHRDPAHHGRDVGCGDAHLLYRRFLDRRRRNDRRRADRRALLRQHRRDPAAPDPHHRETRTSSIRRSIS